MKIITPYSTYLLSRYSTDVKELRRCECCDKPYYTNINRTRCSKKCSKIMNYRRAKENKRIRKTENQTDDRL